MAPALDRSRIAGVVLAGGRATRMGRDKAMVDFGGRPMIAHVIERFAPQVAGLAINANHFSGRFADFEVPVLPDTEPDQPGPLAGIVAGLDWGASAGFTHVVTVPCDAPFLPLGLVDRLVEADCDDRPVTALGPFGLEPLFTLWPVALRDGLRERLAQGLLAVHTALSQLGAVSVEIPAQTPPWPLNLNSPDELENARSFLR